MNDHKAQVVIVDYGLGNLYSVKQACEYAGLRTEITSSKAIILQADAVILPGVGAYGDAMATLKKLDLVRPLQDVAKSKKYLIGICLGMQLLMTESYEFGVHKGLGVIDGEVVPFEDPVDDDSFDGLSRRLKVPQVGWNQVWETRSSNGIEQIKWQDTMLKGISNGEYMYFVHSFFVKPDKSDLIVSTSKYGQIKFCSSLQYNNVFACQFHPERSGKQGLCVYENIASLLQEG